jgi:hypothetical protein
MRTPSAADLVRVWELGRDAPVWHRGLLLLAPAFPQRTFRDLAALTIGQRNICLFALRERLFGPRIAARVRCPRCGEHSEFEAAVRELCPQRPAADIATVAPPRFRLEIDGIVLACTCLTSLDLAALAHDAGAIGADPALLRRAIMTAHAGERAIATDALPEGTLAVIADTVLTHDPLAGLLIGNECPDCGYAWNAPFDIASFMWTETASLVRRLLNDIHVLADAYGWSEASILAMSAPRRQFYLERVAQ